MPPTPEAAPVDTGANIDTHESRRIDRCIACPRVTSSDHKRKQRGLAARDDQTG
jgi:hypothetical protein